MKSKIIEVKSSKSCKEVILFIDRDDDGKDFVRIQAWHNFENVDYIQTVDVTFTESENDHRMMERYIRDFSSTSANDFANSFNY